MTTISRPGHIAALDGLRGLAAMMVVFSHYAKDVKLLDPKIEAIMGQSGVMLFFILSGFLMMHVTTGLQLTRENLRTFFISRLARVVPLFVVTVLGAFLYQKIGRSAGYGGDVLAFNILRNEGAALETLFLLKGHEIFWTIGVEIAFYFVFPIFWAARDKKTIVFLALIAGVFVVQNILQFKYPATPAFGRLILCMHLFMIGMVLNLIVPRLFTFRNDFLQSTVWIVVAVLIAMTISGLDTYTGLLSNNGSYHGLWAERYDIWLANALLFVAVLQIPFLTFFFSLKSMAFLGSVSYSIYLLHRPIVRSGTWFKDVGVLPEVIYFLLVVVPLVCAVSYLSYKYIEVPSRRYFVKKYS